jgi:membrane-bound lytic murein transglycosylase D
VLSEVTRTLAPTQTEDRFQVKGDTIRVAAQEQLSQYATWLDVPVQRLLTLNRLSLRQSPPLGAAVRLDFSKVSATQFTQRRLQYQRGLEEEFLRRHRIGAVVTRKLKSGETLLSVSREAPGVPLWLLQRYNTHLDLNAPRPGTELRIPKVVTRSS